MPERGAFIEELEPVASLGFARNGALLVPVGIDGTVGLWDTVRSMFLNPANPFPTATSHGRPLGVARFPPRLREA